MAAEQHKRCLGCGYILDRLPENRCPECGREFDPADPRTFGIDGQRATRSAVTKLITAGGVTYLFVLALSTFDVAFRIPGERYPLGGTGMDYIGGLFALAAPIVVVVCAVTRIRRLIWLSVISLILAVIWGLNVVRLLGQL